MRLYHGTNIDFNEIDLSKSNPYKDFGQGFYLTSIFEQAKELARKRAKFLGGTALVKTYEFDESRLNDKMLRVKIFDGVSVEWASFINANRNPATRYTHDYDIVIGPIADDGVAFLLDQFNRGLISLSDLAHELTYKELNNQYYFGTPRAIQLLKET